MAADYRPSPDPEDSAMGVSHAADRPHLAQGRHAKNHEQNNPGVSCLDPFSNLSGEGDLDSQQVGCFLCHLPYALLRDRRLSFNHSQVGDP